MSVFKFKQFEVTQHKSAHKIGADGVLLGSWCSLNYQPNNILDIGAGTGLISLMLAQRFSQAQVDAIEIDMDAHEEAVSNFENNVWADRMFCYHAAFQEFYEDEDDIEYYDLIVSNPPFFDFSSIKNKAQSTARNKARFDETLPFEELIYGVYKTLSSTGTFACIIPLDRKDEFLKITRHFQLHLTRITYVKGSKASNIKRCLMEFRFRESVDETVTTETTLVIEKERHVYTAEAYLLFKDFYLKL